MDDAIQAYKAYMRRDVEPRAGAAVVGISYNRVLREVRAHNFVVLEDGVFLDHLAAWADAFESNALAEAVDGVSIRSAGSMAVRDA